MSESDSAESPKNAEKREGSAGAPSPAEGETATGADAAGSVAEGPGPSPEEPAYEAFHQRVRLAEDRLAEVLAAYRELKTETESHRERITRNLERRFDDRRERLLVKFIDILDNLDRALEAAERTDAGQALVDGIILVRTQLLQTLKDEGLERIPVLGLPFDPHVAEAVGSERVEDPEQHGFAIKELMRGYRLHGRVARAARVVVGEFPGRGSASGPAQPQGGEGE